MSQTACRRCQRAGLLWAGLVIAGLVGFEIVSADSPPSALRFGTPQRVGTLDDADVKESSGLAVSRRSRGILWTHNDSGNKDRLFAIDQQARVLGSWRVKKAKNDDWEDMASLVLGNRPYLMIADTGDNSGKRPHVTLYLVEEPPVNPRGQEKGDKEVKLDLAARVDLQFPDGPRDCEALGYDPELGQILLVEKQLRSRNSRVYKGRWPSADLSSGPERLTLELVGQVPITMVTAMDISADGRWCIISGPLSGLLYQRRSGEDWSAAFRRAPQQVDLPLRRQGEAICFGADGRDLWLTSEGKGAPLWHIPAAGANSSAN